MKKNKAIRKYIREHKREGNPPHYPYYETWDEENFSEMYRGGASLSNIDNDLG